VKHIEVVAAIIINEGKVLATQRGYGDLAGGWEFPGGKIEPGEAQESALVREIKEELNAAIEIERFFAAVNYTYDTFSLTMHCYVCKLASGFQLLEHSAARWLARADIDTVEWLPADIEVVEALKTSNLLA
jgi:8-oxo-dGTP diphosphatase